MQVNVWSRTSQSPSFLSAGVSSPVGDGAAGAGVGVRVDGGRRDGAQGESLAPVEEAALCRLRTNLRLNLRLLK